MEQDDQGRTGTRYDVAAVFSAFVIAVLVIYYLYVPAPHLAFTTSISTSNSQANQSIAITISSTSTILQNASQRNTAFNTTTLSKKDVQLYGIPNSSAFAPYTIPYSTQSNANVTIYSSVIYGLNFTSGIETQKAPPLNSVFLIPAAYSNADYPVAVQAIAVLHPNAAAQEAYLNNLQYNSTYSNQSIYLFYNWVPSSGPAPSTVRILQNRTVSALPGGTPFIEISTGPYYGKLEQSKLYFGLGNYTIIISALGISGRLNQSYIVQIANEIYNS